MSDHLLDSLDQALEPWLAARGEATFRGRQVRQRLFRGRAASFAEMTSLSRSLREALTHDFRIWTTQVTAHHRSPDGTEKLVLSLQDGGQIECVLLRDGPRRSICISTQVGCAMGCVFCASGLAGVQRNLRSGEILEQMLRLQQLLPAEERLSHIVVMGMGEPLANLDRLLPALREATAPDGLGISVRRVTISTVGIPAAMDRLTAPVPPYHLAVSLHAPDDALRNRLVPTNRQTGLAAILAAADRYFARSGRRLTYEYVLLGGVNDRVEQAGHLADLLRGRPALLNLIPFNPVDGLPFRTPTRDAVRRFRERLLAAGLNVKVRQRKGDAINAACGQLRRDVVRARSSVPALSPEHRSSQR